MVKSMAHAQLINMCLGVLTSLFFVFAQLCSVFLTASEVYSLAAH